VSLLTSRNEWSERKGNKYIYEWGYVKYTWPRIGNANPPQLPKKKDVFQDCFEMSFCPNSDWSFASNVKLWSPVGNVVLSKFWLKSPPKVSWKSSMFFFSPFPPIAFERFHRFHTWMSSSVSSLSSSVLFFFFGFLGCPVPAKQSSRWCRRRRNSRQVKGWSCSVPLLIFFSIVPTVFYLEIFYHWNVKSPPKPFFTPPSEKVFFNPSLIALSGENGKAKWTKWWVLVS